MTQLVTGAVWGEEVDPVRAYLLREADEPFAALRPKLDAARSEFNAALEGVTDQQAQFRPTTGEGEDAWGIAEVLRHVATIEPIMADRVRLLGTGESLDALPRGVPGYMADVDTRQLTELQQTLGRSYASLLEAIAAIDGHERLDTLAEHRRFGELNCHGWVALHTLHLRDHAQQIGKIKAMPGYPTA
jgi:hypothetical protein